MDIDNLMLNFVESGDPPLFKQGSIDIVKALNEAGRKELDQEVKYVTVKEKVSIIREDGSFLIFEPADESSPKLEMDFAVNFATAIGQQRLKFVLNEEDFETGALARTNTSFSKMLFCKTIGQLFADIRNLGYNKENVLIAKKNSYWNEPALLHEGKSLEAVWHRSILDFLAAIALIDAGRFIGKVTSYKAGHFLDVEMVKLIIANDLLKEVNV
jgi:UDP-3-O-acyl-N-acetylglucosamine deacetylase